MRLSTLFASVLAATPAVVKAIPAPAIDGGEGQAETLETIVYKRDAVLTPRDLDLAKRNGVDVSEMFMHSVVRRSDGDDITIWVHKSLQERDEEPDAVPEDVVKRALSAPKIQWNRGYANCIRNDWGGGKASSSTSPTTGGVNGIVSWANTRRGAILVEQLKKDVWQTLVIAGSNGGTNARLSVRTLHNTHWAWVGTQDIRDLMRGALDRWQAKVNGKWYVEGYGYTDCWDGAARIWNQYNRIAWSLDKYTANVPAG